VIFAFHGREVCQRLGTGAMVGGGEGEGGREEEEERRAGRMPFVSQDTPALPIEGMWTIKAHV
jgi:hypothetical protein